MIAFSLILVIDVSNAFSGNADLSWDPNTESDLAGYKVYYGTTSGNYGTPIDVGNQTTYIATGLGFGAHYFTVTAYDISGNESGPSVEVRKTISTSDPATPTSAGPATPPTTPTSFANAAAGGGGCGIIRPGSGEPPKPEDAAEMLMMLAIILAMLLAKGSGVFPGTRRSAAEIYTLR